MTAASACAKIILLGEHAVVYGRPAVAVPLPGVRATAEVCPLPGEPDGRVRIQAPSIGLDTWLHEMPQDHPLAFAVRLTLQRLEMLNAPALQIVVTSDIPIASGLGSGAAVSVALARALGQHLGHPFSPEVQSQMAFEVDKLHHGTPSGIDNTVVAFERPVYFKRGQSPEPFTIQEPFVLVIGDTGHPSATSVAVGKVRRGWLADKVRFEGWFDAIGRIAAHGRDAIRSGKIGTLGQLMNENQTLLEALGVDSPQLAALIAAAREAGALGAKLSGAGLGGCMIALSETDRIAKIQEAIVQAGAGNTLVNEVR